MDKKQIKKKIYWHELNHSGFRKINGGDVKVLNLKISKREKKAYADIVLFNDIEGRKERYNDCFYSFDSLGVEE